MDATTNGPTLAEQLRLAKIEIARLKEVIRKLEKGARKSGSGSSSDAFPGAHRGY